MLKLRVREVAQSIGVLNQTQLQTRAGLTAPLAGRYWHGEMKHVSLQHLAKIAQALGVSAKDLLEEGEE